VERNADRPNYASLVDQGRGAAEEKCLAEAVYFEARSEPEAGQAAVAQVVLNRVQSGLYPPSICGVVYQNRHRHNACQFSFACEGKSLRVTEGDAWKNATRIAHEVLQGETYLADVGGSTHYHANYVKPRWARALKKMDVIGHHIFYTLRPGQT
jgi:spore germination cell wall hydrolase CwlJ-like protein